MRFHDLRLSEPLVRAVASEGYTTPTPIQTKAIPHVLEARDVLGCARTGTGKTGAFALPILQLLSRNHAESTRPIRAGKPRALILCPTRELATQIFESFRTYGRYLPLRHTVVFGGISQAGQVRSLRAGTDVLVSTPGRLLDLIGQGFVDLRAIEVLVLDEADRMLDMGFIRDIRKVVGLLPARRQTLLFSATMPAEIRGLADSILRDPVFVQADRVSSTIPTVAQSVYHVARNNKPMLLERLLRKGAMPRTLVFTRTKHGADKLVRILRRSGIEAGAIHGNKTQSARTRALNDFKTGRSPLLVATDIASRGIDVDEISHVVNFDMPEVPETYVHRIGRTARAGASGIALSFCDREEINDLRSIERLIGTRLEVIESEPDLALEASAAKPEPRRQRAAVSPAADASRHAQGRSRSGHARRSFASGRDERRSSRGRNGGRPRRTRSAGR